MYRLHPQKLQTLLLEYRLHRVMDAAAFSIGGGLLIRRPVRLPQFSHTANSNHSNRFA